MDTKSLRRIREVNIKRLEESLPPLEKKIARAEMERKFCPKVNSTTGVCDSSEKRAMQLVAKLVQEHRGSSLISSIPKDSGNNAKGDYRSKKKNAANDEAAMKAHEQILKDFKDEKERLEGECKTLTDWIDRMREFRSNFALAPTSDVEDQISDVEEKESEGEEAEDSDE